MVTRLSHFGMSEQLQTPPAAWKLRAAKGWEHKCMTQLRGNQHISSEKAAAEWPMIKAFTESFEELTAMVKTDCMHSLHLISCSLFMTKGHNFKISIAIKVFLIDLHAKCAHVGQ